ncbi:MAG: class F sortase [Acidimicrobiales bacterium]
MTWADSIGNERRRSLRWGALAIVLLLVGAGSLAVGLRGHAVALAGPAGPHLAPPGASVSTAAGSTRPPSEVVVGAVARSVPVALRIPAIGVAVGVSGLGLNPDGTVQVPTDFHKPGWFRLGPSPGQVGSAVILGHVDSYKGPAVFFRLRSLRAGDGVEVSLADGVVAHFVVNTVEIYPKDRFPAHQVYASHGYSALQIVTCGGKFDTHTRSYLSNVVAYASLVATTPAAGDTGPARRSPV